MFRSGGPARCLAACAQFVAGSTASPGDHTQWEATSILTPGAVACGRGPNAARDRKRRHAVSQNRYSGASQSRRPVPLQNRPVTGWGSESVSAIPSSQPTRCSGAGSRFQRSAWNVIPLKILDTSAALSKWTIAEPFWFRPPLWYALHLFRRCCSRKRVSVWMFEK